MNLIEIFHAISQLGCRTEVEDFLIQAGVSRNLRDAILDCIDPDGLMMGAIEQENGLPLVYTVTVIS